MQLTSYRRQIIQRVIQKHTPCSSGDEKSLEKKLVNSTNKPSHLIIVCLVCFSFVKIKRSL